MLIWSPVTVILTAGSGVLAGPAVGEPSVMENELPWQVQLIRPSLTVETVQLWWVQVELNALNSPAAGWVTTTFWSAKIIPPPSVISEVVVSGPAEGDGVTVAPSPPLPQAARNGTPTPTVSAPVNACRRLRAQPQPRGPAGVLLVTMYSSELLGNDWAPR